MKYCKEITHEISQHLRHGSNRTDACYMSNISYDTFCEWMKKPEFSESIKKAESRCKNRNIKIIQRAAVKTWQAAAWFLERKFKDEYAQKMPDNTKSKEEMSKEAVDAATAVLRLLEKVGRNGPDVKADSGRHEVGLVNGKVGVQAQSPAIPSL